MTLQTALDVLHKERAPAYRARQLTHAVYTELADRWDEVTALPRPLRERLERDAPLRTLTEQASQRAEDGTIKLQLRTHDGYPLEAVAMSHGAAPHRLPLVAVRLRAGLHVLRHGPHGPRAQPHARRDQRAAAAARAPAARRAGRAHLERRDDGHGRAVPQLRQRALGDPHDQLARGLRARRAPDRDLDRRLDPGDRQARRGADAGQARALAARARRRAAQQADAGHEALSRSPS